MKTNCLIIAIFLIAGLQANSQISVSGTVRDSLNQPVPFAQVYFSKSTIGTAANDSGVYKLNVPQSGLYELVVSSIGYHSFTKTIVAENKDIVENVKLRPAAKVLDEVTVVAKDKQYKKNYAMFSSVFLGETSFASQCRIMNPEDIRLQMDKEKNTLTAHSLRPILIENKALGYLVSYQLSDFKYCPTTGLFYISGNSYFISMPGNLEEEHRWKQQRLLVYYGSQLHFIRSLYAASLANESFDLHEYSQGIRDEDIISKRSLTQDQLVLARYLDCVEVFFPRKLVIYYKGDIPVQLGTSDLSTVSKVSFTKPIRVYPNGRFDNGYSVTWEGRMASDRIACLLPFDYQPVMY
ncbi:MAG TPA: carboxypeptidase-like regulatory domain-containing protein [Bacteroidales bacterium]|nr:carboxypeptidase-like regulatory domain-containing protein [Bacteroidales bacterium]